MRRRLLTEELWGGGVRTAYEAEAGDVVFYSTSSSKKYIIPNSEINPTTEFPSSWIPIGVVAIPGRHGVYGSAICGVISLVDMSCDSPDSGSTTSKTIYWGSPTRNTSLTDYGRVPYVGLVSSPGNSSGTVTGEYYFGWIPGDSFSYKQCPHDTDAYYDNVAGSQHYAIPSPYLTNGNRNPGYYRTASPSSTSNCLSVFNGKSNTTTLCNLSTAQSDWRTASSISNYATSGYYPAACCCWRFHTEGTKQGDWHLPSAGELGYVVTKFRVINDIIQVLNGIFYRQGYRSSAILQKDYWTSTEYDIKNARHIYFGEGYVHYTNKDVGRYVRAMMRLS